MKNKKIIITIIFVFITMLLTQIIYANSGATVTLTPNKTTIKSGEEISVNISIKNTAIEAGIEDVSGYLSFDENVFELVTVDIEDKIEELNLDEEKQALLEEYVGMLDVLDLTEKYIIAGMKDGSDYLISIAAFSAEGIIPKTSTDIVVGKINFAVLTAATNTTTSIKITDLYANGEEEVSEAATSQLTISSETEEPIVMATNTVNGISSTQIGVTSTNKNATINKNTTNKVNTVSSSKVNNNTSNTIKTEAQQELAEAGADDAWPTLVAILISLGLYINYRRFKEIEDK